MLTATWTADPHRDGAAAFDHVWSLRPSVLRPVFLVALTAVSALVVAMIFVTPSDGWARVLAWVLLGLLVLLALGVLAIRVLVRTAVRTAVRASGLTAGEECRVMIDEVGWHASSAGRDAVYAWTPTDVFTVTPQHIIVCTLAPRRWLPARVLLAPRVAFDREPAGALRAAGLRESSRRR